MSTNPVVFGAEARFDPLYEESSDAVVSVVSDSSDNTASVEHPGQELNGRGTLGLCPPPTEEVVSVVFRDDQEVVFDSGHRTELPDALRLLALVGADEDPYLPGGPWAYADADDLGGRVFFITQNERYLDTDMELMSEGRIGGAVGRKGMTKWAWVKHDKDVYTADEAAKIPGAQVGSAKAPHYHIAVMRKSFASLGVAARAFGVGVFPFLSIGL